MAADWYSVGLANGVPGFDYLQVQKFICSKFGFSSVNLAQEVLAGLITSKNGRGVK